MKSYNFTLIVSRLNPELDDATMDRLYEAGCDDATISVQKGLVVIEFDREARSFISAVKSAILDVVKAGGKIERLEPDYLVSAADIAVRSGLSRAAITHYAKGARRDGFPQPIARITTESPLWDWAEISSWLHRRQKLDLYVAVQARVIRELNLRLSVSQMPRSKAERSLERIAHAV